MMETLDILIMNWRDVRNPDAGGAEVFTQEVARRWAAWGHRVTVLTSAFRNGLREEQLDGVSIVRCGDRFTVYRRARRTFEERFAGNVDVAVDEINTRPFFATKFVDGSTQLFALIFQLAREFWSYETPFPVSAIGRYLLEPRWLRPYRSIPTLTISDSTRHDLVGFGFRDVSVIPVGVSVPPQERIPAKEDRPTVLYVGRLKRAKLPDHALRAFAIVKERLPAAQLWIVGDGYMRTSLERGAPPGTTFFGRIFDEEKARLMQRAHVLMFPAVREGWGLTVIEANASGTPAVGYRVPGLEDSIRDGDTGLLVPFGDIAQLAAATISLLENRSKRIALAENGLQWARRFNWNETAIQLLRCFQERHKTET